MTSINDMNTINKVERLNIKYYNKKIAEPQMVKKHIIDKKSVMENKIIIRDYKEKRDKLFEIIIEIDNIEKSLKEILEEVIIEKIIKFYLKEFSNIKKQIIDDKSNFNEIYNLYNNFILEKESVDTKKQKQIKELKRKNKNIDSKILSISDYLIEEDGKEIFIEELQLVSKNQKFIDKLYFDLNNIDNSLSIKIRNNNKAENNLIKQLEIDSSKLERLYIEIYNSKENIVDEESIDLEILNQILDAFKNTRPTPGYDYLRFIRDKFKEKKKEVFDEETTHKRR